MKAISVWEPWASAIAEQCKWNETRSWYTSYRGTLLICASKKKSRDLRDHSGYLSIEFPKLIFLKDYDRLRFGYATAIVTLSDCVPTEDIRRKSSPMEIFLSIILFDCIRSSDWDKLSLVEIAALVIIIRFCRIEYLRGKLSPMELALGDYSDGRFAWVFSSIDKIYQPLPVKGKQGFFDVKVG